MSSAISLALCFALVSPAVLGDAAIIDGPGFAFIIAAPNGWVLDAKSGRRDDAAVVFYPAGESWSRAKVVMYANPTPKGKDKSLQGVIAADVKRFRTLNPGMPIEDRAPIALKSGEKALVKVFRGTKMGDTEYVAYADEEKHVVMFVLSGPSQNVDVAYPRFLELLNSYSFISSDVSLPVSSSPLPPNNRMNLTRSAQQTDRRVPCRLSACSTHPARRPIEWERP